MRRGRIYTRAAWECGLRQPTACSTRRGIAQVDGAIASYEQKAWLLRPFAAHGLHLWQPHRRPAPPVFGVSRHGAKAADCRYGLVRAASDRHGSYQAPRSSRKVATFRARFLYLRVVLGELSLGALVHPTLSFFSQHKKEAEGPHTVVEIGL